MWHYAYLNTGLTMLYNGEKFYSENGLYDLLNNQIEEGTSHYPVIHLKGEDIEIAMTHMRNQYGESYHSFVNGQHTTMGGTHQTAFAKLWLRLFVSFMERIMRLQIFDSL